MWSSKGGGEVISGKLHKCSYFFLTLLSHCYVYITVISNATGGLSALRLGFSLFCLHFSSTLALLFILRYNKLSGVTSNSDVQIHRTFTHFPFIF